MQRSICSRYILRKSKLTVFSEYLCAFISELQELCETGIFYNGLKYEIIISSFVCDAPARAFLKNIKGHTGYSAREKCSVFGANINSRVVFLELDAPLRTNETFRAMTDAEHHKETSPLLLLPIDVISTFPIDYMRNVCLGVMRKLLVYWQKGPFQCRFNVNSSLISCYIDTMSPFMPKEFARRPRALTEMDRWKATEFREFLLYVGPVLLRENINKSIYDNFLLLSCAIRILLSPNLCCDSNWIDIAEKLLLTFVEHGQSLYGPEFLIYNVHSLIHLAQDARIHGALDKISAFTYESYLGRLKKLLRKPSQPLQQIVRRLNEQTPRNKIVEKMEPVFQHLNDVSLPSHVLPPRQQYKKAVCSIGTLSIYDGNNCIWINEKPAIVTNIFLQGGISYIFCRKFLQSYNYFEYPFPSKNIGIMLVYQKDLSPSVEQHQLTDIERKLVLLSAVPRSRKFVIMSLLHQS